jgi:hypothetical protein
MSLTVICNDTFSPEIWQAALPGVLVSEARSKHASKYQRTNDTANAIESAFASVRHSDDYVSAKTLKGLAGLSHMKANRFAEALMKARQQGIPGWFYTKERRGFTRCPFPPLN